MQGGLGAAAVGSVAAARGRVVRAAQLHDPAVVVLDHLVAGDEVGRTQPHLAARREPEELARRVLHEVFALDPELAPELHLARARLRVLRVVGHVHLLDLPLGVVGDDDLERVEHPEAARRRAVEHVAHAVLEHADLDDAVGLGHAHEVDEIADALGGEAAAADAGHGGHPRVVPAAHVTLVHQAQQEALRQHRVREVQARELVLVRARRHRQVLDEPVVQRPVRLELERADGVCHALDGVGLPVGEVVHGVDAPGAAGARVLGVQDAVEHGVTQVDVRRRHVDLRAQHAGAVGELAGAHAREQVEALAGRPVAPRARPARLGQRAAVLADLVGREIVDVGPAVADEAHRPLVELLEVVRGVVQVVAPVEAQPAHVALDGVDVLLLLLHRVGVVEAEVAVAAELLRDAEVQADGLGMADVQVAVGLGREAGDDAVVAPFAQVGGDDVADEVAALGGRGKLGAHGERG